MCGTLDSLLALHVLTDCEGHWILVRSVCHFQKKWSDFVTEHTINEYSSKSWTVSICGFRVIQPLPQ